MKQAIVRSLRRTGLLPWAEQTRSWLANVRSASDNRSFLRENPAFAPPPKFLMYDAHGHVNYRSYFNKGRKAAGAVAQLAARHFGPSSPVAVCEWGCGPARILRHLPSQLPPGSKVFGTDYNEKSIQWCAKNLPEIDFRVNGLAPPLPLKTGEVDMLFAVSVLTHLSEEMHYAWIAECRRVVRPGGLIMLTVHGDRCVDGLGLEERKLYDAGKIVVRGDVLEGSRTYVAFHSPRFMRQTLLKDMQILDHNPADMLMVFAGAQDVYLLRNNPPQDASAAKAVCS